jgi:phosphoenolpyruvate carboxykinase (ATP)
VLPPVSKLSPAEAMYHFLSGYTARVAGTEVGVREPQVAFSACFSAAFLVRHPTVYAEMLAAKMQKHKAAAWLVNTGWSGGAYGVGLRIKLEHTRAIIDAIHAGALDDVAVTKEPVFGLAVPVRCPGVPEKILLPEMTWPDRNAYRAAAQKLASLFMENFNKYADQANPEVRAAGPIL